MKEKEVLIMEQLNQVNEVVENVMEEVVKQPSKAKDLAIVGGTAAVVLVGGYFVGKLVANKVVKPLKAKVKAKKEEKDKTIDVEATVHNDEEK